MGGELHQKDKEAPEPVLGVGAGVVVDTHHPQLRGLLGRSVGFLLTVCIFHIVLFHLVSSPATRSRRTESLRSPLGRIQKQPVSYLVVVCSSLRSLPRFPSRCERSRVVPHPYFPLQPGKAPPIRIDVRWALPVGSRWPSPMWSASSSSAMRFWAVGRTPIPHRLTVKGLVPIR